MLRLLLFGVYFEDYPSRGYLIQACLKVLLKYICSCCQLTELLYKLALFHLLSPFQVTQQVPILTRLWLTGQSHLMLFDTIEQEFCTTSEIKTMKH